MKLLVVTPEAPAPRHVNGGATRQFQLYRRLIELGNEVTVVAAFPSSDDPYDDELRAHGFDVIASKRPRARSWEVARALLRRPVLLFAPLYKSAKELIAAVLWVDLAPKARAVLAERDFDAVVIEFESAQSWLGDLEFDAPALLTLHEFESPQFFAKASRIGGFSGWLRSINARRSRRSERKWIPRYDAVVTMSSAETALLDQTVPNHPPAFAIGNGADPDAFALTVPSPGHQRVLFAGTMLFPPNRGAAEWLAREVWPLVRERAPKASLEIVGRSPAVATRALGELPGITVTADAPTMAPHLNAADICAIPMLEGGGTRLKFSDAMAAGRAIVSTTNGASGIDARNRREALIADDPAAFAAAIVELLEDPELRARLGASARARAAAEYNWDALGERMATVLATTTGHATGGSGEALLATGI
jgi:glycosyltransferase involved in cell wall biosynthesis